MSIKKIWTALSTLLFLHWHAVEIIGRHVSHPPPSGSETLAGKPAAKLVRGYANEGHASHTLYISEFPATQAPMEVPPLRTQSTERSDTFRGYVRVPDVVRLVSQA